MKKLVQFFVVMLAFVQIAGAQSKESFKITEADFVGAWTFEKAEYYEVVGGAPVLKDEITSPDLLYRLFSLCLNDGVKNIFFIGDGAEVEMLLMFRKNVECHIIEFDGGRYMLDMFWRDENVADSPVLSFHYEITREREDGIVLTHEALCHDQTGAMHQNILKMFLKINR